MNACRVFCDVRSTSSTFTHTTTRWHRHSTQRPCGVQTCSEQLKTFNANTAGRGHTLEPALGSRVCTCKNNRNGTIHSWQNCVAVHSIPTHPPQSATHRAKERGGGERGCSYSPTEASCHRQHVCHTAVRVRATTAVRDGLAHETICPPDLRLDLNNNVPSHFCIFTSCTLCKHCILLA